MSYLARFHQLAEELKAHPKVRLLAYHSFPAVDPTKVSKAEQLLGQPLDRKIKEFYRETNGLQLRWIFENNEDLDERVHQWKTKAEHWNYAKDAFRAEDGVIFILPFEAVFIDPIDHGLDILGGQEEIEFMNDRQDLLAFYQKIRPFDAFSSYCNMAFYMDGTAKPPLLMGDEHCSNYTDSRLTDFESYLEFLLATKGLCRKRKSFYGQYQGHELAALLTDEAYWASSKDRTSLDGLVFEEEFPLANQAGASTSGYKTKAMQEAAFAKAPLSQAEFDLMLREHDAFLASGGAGGSWQLLMINGQVFGTYKSSGQTKGKQAIFDLLHFDQDLDLQELPLPYSSWCGAWLKYQNFSDSDLEGSLFVDAMLEKTIFADANLKGVDFSRANLKGASFMNANLSGADFENCDLRDTDFRGANLEGARFPGALLKNIRR
jgi:uncharacterized protein YjbI with pentapeptide repeats